MRTSDPAFDDELLLTKDFGDSALARRFARDVLRRFGYGGSPDPVVLVVSELVSNALKHGGGGTRLRLRGDVSSVRIEVADRRRLLLRRGRGGWGLRLIDLLSCRWGVSPRLHGKVVWCEMRAGDGDSNLLGRRHDSPASDSVADIRR